MLRPLKDRIVISRITEEVKTPGGIYIPENHKSKPLQGKILAVGPECHEAKVGDTIYFGKYSGTEVKINGEELLIMKEEEIIGVVS